MTNDLLAYSNGSASNTFTITSNTIDVNGIYVNPIAYHETDFSSNTVIYVGGYRFIIDLNKEQMDRLSEKLSAKGVSVQDYLSKLIEEDLKNQEVEISEGRIIGKPVARKLIWD